MSAINVAFKKAAPLRNIYMNVFSKTSETEDSQLKELMSVEAADFGKLSNSLRESCSDNSSFYDRYRKNYNVINCIWSNQSDDQRKKSTSDIKAFPYDGASDAKIPFVQDLCRFLEEQAKVALGRMRIQAIPLTNNIEDVSKSSDASYLLKHIQNSVPNWNPSMDYCARQLWRYTGVAIAKVGWNSERRLVKKKYSLDRLDPQIQELILSGQADQELIGTFAKIFPKMSDKKLAKCLNDLREKGFCVVSEEIKVRDGVKIEPKSLSEDIVFPSSAMDIQDIPYLHEILTLTPESLLQKQIDEDGISKSWAEYLINNMVGVDSVQSYINGESANSQKISKSEAMRGLIQVIETWEKRVDEDGSIGIYKTLWHPGYSEEIGRFELSDCEDGLYPFVAVKRENDSRRIYDTKALPEILEGLQFVYKECVDNASNRESITTFPPFEIRAMGDFDGNNDTEIGPGTPFRTHGFGAFEWKSPPLGGEAINIEVRKETRFIADQFVGRPTEEVVPQEAAAKVQGEMNVFALFVTEVLKMAFSKFCQYASDVTVFKVTGSNRMISWKNEMNSNYDFIITLDADNIDDTVKKLEMFTMLAQQDRTGKINMSKIIERAAQRIDMGMADEAIEGDESAYNKSLEEQRNMINTITSGQDVDMKQDEPFNKIKAEYFMQYMQSPAGQSGMQNPIIAPLLEKHAKQHEFKYQQTVSNPQVGRIGTSVGSAGQA